MKSLKVSVTIKLDVKRETMNLIPVNNKQITQHCS